MRVRVLENPKIPGGFTIHFPYYKPDVDRIKLCLGTSWDKSLKAWTTEGPEVLLDMQRFDIEVEWISGSARKIAEEFRQQLWDTMDCRLLDIHAGDFDYQRQGADFLAAMPRAILADDMGTGKSKQALDAAAKIGANYFLVLCSKTQVYNWLNEVQKWHPEWTAGTPPVATGSKKAKAAYLEFWNNPPNVVVANYEKLSRQDWPVEEQWDVVILDEATRFKTATTNIYKNVRQTIKYIKYAWALTGTPLEKNLTEMYNLFAMMRPTVLGTYMRFKEQHLETDTWASNVVGAKNLQLLQERIAPFILRRTKGEVLKQLPPKFYQNKFVRLSPEEQEAYNHMTTRFNNTLTEWNVSGDDNSLTQILRMRQFCCTPDLFTQDLGRGSKFETLQEILDEWNGRVLIFCYFTEVTQRLAEWLNIHPRAYIDGEVKDEERFRRTIDFNNGELGRIFVSSDAGNQGLNITGANLIVHFDQLQNAQKMKQREDRLHRIGQTDNVTVINLMCVDTVDYGTYLLNREEEQLFKDVVDGAETMLLRKLDAPRLRKLVEGKL